MNIKELQLETKNVSLIKNFYVGTIGLKILQESDSSVSFKVGASVLTFVESSSNVNPYYHYAINIPENQIHAAIKWLGLKVNLIEHENSSLIDFPNWNAHSVYFFDSAGNIVELIARHDLDNSSNDPFSVKSLLSISEVGIPVESVKEFHDTISSQLNEKLWSGNLDTFAAIGSQEGLLIVVTTHRNWFPTDKPCNVYPLELKLRMVKTGSGIIKYSVYSIDSI